MHKRVCGKNPFEFPPLSDEEAEEAFELRNSPLMGESPARTLMDYLAATVEFFGIHLDFGSALSEDEMNRYRDDISKAIPCSLAVLCPSKD